MSGVTAAPAGRAFGAATAPRARVAFQGELGAYSEGAVRAWFGAGDEPVPARACADVAGLVAEGAVEFGLLAVENTLAGSVVAAYDALAAVPALGVVGEVVLPIHHCVLAVAGATLAGLRAIESHPVALDQCRRFFAAHPWIEARAAYDTAGAARQAAERGDRAVGALAGRGAAERFGLAVLAEAVEDRADNQTRFYVVARGAGSAVPDGVRARTALLAVTENAPGALLRLLEPIATAGLNLSKLESRPTGAPWTYRFVLEVEHLSGDPQVPAALAAMGRAARELRVFGTFRRARAGAGDA